MQKQKTPVVRITGELDHHTADSVRRRLDKLIADERVKDLTLDLSGLTFMDSSGIGVILGRYKTLSKRGGRLYVTHVGRNVDRIFRLSGMYQVLKRID